MKRYMRNPHSLSSSFFIFSLFLFMFVARIRFLMPEYILHRTVRFVSIVPLQKVTQKVTRFCQNHTKNSRDLSIKYKAGSFLTKIRTWYYSESSNLVPPYYIRPRKNLARRFGYLPQSYISYCYTAPPFSVKQANIGYVAQK